MNLSRKLTSKDLYGALFGASSQNDSITFNTDLCGSKINQNDSKLHVDTSSTKLKVSNNEHKQEIKNWRFVFHLFSD